MIKKLLIFICLFVSLQNQKLNAEQLQKYSPDERRNKKMLVIGLPSIPQTLDPTKLRLVWEFLIAQCIYQTIVRVSDTGELVGDLVSEWKISENGKLYTFKINQAAYFNDSRRVTSNDVVWSLSRHMWEGSATSEYLREHVVGASDVANGAPISGFKEVSEQEFSISLKQAYSGFLDILTIPAFSILPKDFSAANVVGSGPYSVLRRETESELRLEVTKLHSIRRVETQKISLTRVSTINELQKALSDGTIDIHIGMGAAESDEIKLTEQFKIVRSDSLSNLHLYFNQEKDYLNDTNFRKDLGHLIASIADESVRDSKALRPITTFFPAGVMPIGYYKRKIAPLSPEEFRERWSRKVWPKKLRILARSASFGESFIQKLRTKLRQSGIEADIPEDIPIQDLLRSFQEGNYDLTSLMYLSNLPDPDGFVSLLRPEKELSLRVPSKNYLDRLNKFRYLEDINSRLKGYTVETRSFEDLWWIVPVFQVKQTIVHRSDIQIPATSYRYEAELWNMIWKAKK